MLDPVENKLAWGRTNLAQSARPMESRGIMMDQSILIADDETNLCRILSAELKKSGYGTTIVHDGARAVEEAGSSDFQMVILDVRMPVLDGFSALRQIRKLRKEVPIIIMTAYEGHDTVASALAMGATACVSKPFDLESLVALVKATLDEGRGQGSMHWNNQIRTVLFNKQQPVIVELHDGDNAGQYPSTIVYTDDQTLGVLCPDHDGGCLTLTAGSPVTIGFAGDDAFYTFETTVLTTRDSDGPMMIVNKPAVIYRVQRRKFRRTPARVAVDLALMKYTSTEHQALVRVYTEDIGVGGFKIITECEWPDGADLDIRSISVPGLGQFSSSGKVTRVCKAPINSHYGWEYGIKFTKMDDGVRRALRVMVDTDGVS